MKKILFTLTIALMACVNTFAQKYALIDMDYILKQIPQYEMANEQLNQISKRWQTEVETLSAEADQLYKQYQADMVYLTKEQQNQRENVESDRLLRDALRPLDAEHLRRHAEQKRRHHGRNDLRHRDLRSGHAGDHPAHA